MKAKHGTDRPRSQPGGYERDLAAQFRKIQDAHRRAVTIIRACERGEHERAKQLLAAWKADRGAAP